MVWKYHYGCCYCVGTPDKPVMSSEATAYPKLLKIYKELSRQNEIIFAAEKERNALEVTIYMIDGLMVYLFQ